MGIRSSMKQLRRLLGPVLRIPMMSVLTSRIAGFGPLVSNMLARIKRGRKTPYVCSFPHFDPEQSLSYLNEVYEDYFTYSGLASSAVEGKHVLEVGPGENLGVGLRFAADGAARVVSADRFRSLRPPAEQVEVYRRLISSLNAAQRTRLELALNLRERDYTINSRICTYLTEAPLESLYHHLAPSTFDLIVSRAVLEHIFDIDQALGTMDILLKPGGVMIHEVDLRDHGMFTRYGLNPLTFLTFGKRSWYMMSSHTGSPNRVPMRHYFEELDRRGYDIDILKVHAVREDGEEVKVHKKELEYGVDYDDNSVKMVDGIRPWLNRDVAHLPAEELLVGAFFLVCRKPDSIVREQAKQMKR